MVWSLWFGHCGLVAVICRWCLVAVFIGQSLWFGCYRSVAISQPLWVGHFEWPEKNFAGKRSTQGRNLNRLPPLPTSTHAQAPTSSRSGCEVSAPSRHDPTSYLLACPYPTTFEVSDLRNVSFYYQCAVFVVIINSAGFLLEPLNTKIYTTLSQKSSNRLAKKVMIVSNTKRLYHRPKHLLTKSLFCLLENILHGYIHHF